MVEVLQWWHRLDIAEAESSKYRALQHEVVEKVSRVLGPPSQPFICQSWVPGLSLKKNTDRIRFE
jgi:hypothetical protein